MIVDYNETIFAQSGDFIWAAYLRNIELARSPDLVDENKLVGSFGNTEKLA
jgi:hypothetical protein